MRNNRRRNESGNSNNKTPNLIGALCFIALILAAAMHFITWLIKLCGGTPSWGILSSLVMIILYFAVAYQGYNYVKNKSNAYKATFWIALTVALLLIILPLSGVKIFIL